MARMAAPDYLLDIGNELVKGRFGHTFLMNYDQRPPYSTDYDESFDHWIWQKAGPVPGYGLAYPHEAVLRERGANSVAAAAHPTSWWWQEGEFITNIAATVGFDVLCGTLDAFVVMGYRAERPYLRLTPQPGN